MDFGNLIVEPLLYSLFTGDTGISGTVGNSIHSLTYVPQGATVPALLYYQEHSRVDGPVTTNQVDHINGETMRYVVRIMDTGTSYNRIKEAARAQRRLLGGLIVTAPTGEQVTFTYLQNFSPNSSFQDGQGYRHLGSIYSVDVTRGGF